MVPKIKIAYITVNENLNSALLRRQVIELLSDIKSKAPEFEIKIFSFHGVLSLINHRKDIRETRVLLRNVGIDIMIIPNICPWPFPNINLIKTDVGLRPNTTWNKYASKIFKFITLPLLLSLRYFGKYKLFHCRSYPATSIAIFLKQFSPRTAVLFDPRSDFPEENVTSGVWADGSSDFNYWKKSEALFLKNANAVACIGPTYVDHYTKNTPSFIHFIAPNNVRCSEFRRNLADRSAVRKKLSIEKSERLYVYLGGMSSNGWHQPGFYVKYFDNLAKIDKNFKFLFLVPSFSTEIIKNEFGSRENILIISPSFDEVSKYLSAADLGMMFLHKSKIAVGTKIGEYLAASLPVIVNHNCLGAVALIMENQQIGHVINLGLGDIDSENRYNKNDFNSENALIDSNDLLFEFSCNYFDNTKISDTYIKNYHKILNSAN
jgi:hypothetical protein